MDGRAVLFVLGNLLAILGLAMAAPLLVAIFHASQAPDSSNEVLAFAVTSGAALFGGMVMRRLFAGAADQVRLREGFAIVSLSWLLLTVVGMLPYLLIGATDTVTDAFFETMSGFTTTGASIFRDFTRVPPGLMFWRCMTQWLGGMGVVVLSVALLPMLGVGGFRLLKAEAPGGVTYERERPRITESAKELWRIYLFLSALMTVLLMISGMSLYDAICHSFTAMSTGGFSTHIESVGYFNNASTQWIIIAFMFLAGTNFSLYARLIRRDWFAFFRNVEFRWYAAVLGAAVGAAIWALADTGLSEKMIRDATFQVVSIGTTTGYATTDFNLWPNSSRLVLFLLMFIGGCMGSTAGGIKVSRLVIYAKSVVRELHRLIYPHAVRPVRVGEKVIEAQVLANIFAFGAVFLLLFVIGSLVMAAYGYGLVTSMTASAAALGNIGPGLVAVGPTANWGHLPAFAKWVMSFLMLFGRLEIYSVLILFTPWVWRR